MASTSNQNDNGIIHDLDVNGYKTLISRASGKNFKLSDSKSDIDKLFKEDADSFIEQLRRLSQNLAMVADEYKKEIDRAKVADLAALINSLNEDARNSLIESLGISPSKGSKAKAKPNVTTKRERVDITVNGKQYKIPVTGNMNQELKDLVSASGLERSAFIEKYKSVQA